MNRLTTLWHKARSLVLAAAVWLAMHGMAIAQAAGDKKEEAGSSGPPYVGAYFIVILCVGLGLFVVCNPSLRKERTKAKKADIQAVEKT